MKLVLVMGLLFGATVWASQDYSTPEEAANRVLGSAGVLNCKSVQAKMKVCTKTTRAGAPISSVVLVQTSSGWFRVLGQSVSGASLE